MSSGIRELVSRSNAVRLVAADSQPTASDAFRTSVTSMCAGV